MKIYYLLVLLFLAVTYCSGQEQLLGVSSAASTSYQQIANALDAAEQQAAAMQWASGSPFQVPLGGNAISELQEANNALLHKDLAYLLSSPKNTVQLPSHIRVQPIIQHVPAFLTPQALPVLQANTRVEQMKKHRAPMLRQAAISSKQPMLQRKSSLAQAVLSRGMLSAQDQLEQNLHLQFAGVPEFNQQFQLGVGANTYVPSVPITEHEEYLSTIGNIPNVNWQQQQQQQFNLGMGAGLPQQNINAYNNWMNVPNANTIMNRIAMRGF